MKKNNEQKKNKQSTFYKFLDSVIDRFVGILTYVTFAFLLLVPLLFIYLNTFQFHYFIDEKFHIPQTVQYCNRNFFQWDPKITTLPGLYLFAALILGPFNLCITTYLRFINVICTYLNFLLISKIVYVLNEKRKSYLGSHSSFLLFWNITFFPPLFFWFFLFYTDVFSVTLVLTMFLLHMKNQNKTAAFVGALSVCVRQTNIIWVALLGIEKGLDVIVKITKKPHLINTLNLLPCVKTLYNIFKAKARKGIFPFLKFIKLTCKPFLPYLLVLVAFIIFFILNEGIVVGDRTAHKPTTHVTQLFYYSAFVLGFSWPYLLPYFYDFLQFMYKNKLKGSCFICFIALVVHYNTLVHPYVLADNRHYTFYIWKNFMNRYIFFKYLLVPIYTFSIYAILRSLSHLRLLSIVIYLFCICIVLVPQLLLEPRYFIIPYILFRLYQNEPKNWQIVAETFTTFIINTIQFLIFTNKSFNWQDEEYPQRITW